MTLAGSLADYLERIEAGRSFSCDTRPAGDDEWGVVKVSAMTYGEFRPAENKALLPGEVARPEHQICQGDLLLSRANTTAYVGASVLVPPLRQQLLLSDKSLRLVPKAGVDRRWLWLMLLSPPVRDYISARASGTKDSMRNIGQRQLLAAPMPVVEVEEQQRIVAVLEDQLSRLQASTAYVSAADRRAAVLPLSVADAVVASAAPQDWRSLREIAQLQGGIQKQPKRAPVNNKAPYLRVANETKRGLDLSEVHDIELFDGEAARFALQIGDLLVVEGNGSASQIGRGAMWRGEILGAVHQNHLIRVRPREVQAEYLELVWNSSVVRRRLRGVASSTSGLFTLSKGKLSSLLVPVTTRARQHAAVAEAEALQSSTDRLRSEIARAQLCSVSLRRSLLTAAFSGQL